jgi:class 3 adenylate cyclase
MSSPPAFLATRTAPSLAAVVEELAKTAWAVSVFDDEWRMVWVSDEQKALLGEWDEAALGYGQRVPETFGSGPWREALSDDGVMRWTADVLPWIVADTPGGAEAVAAMLGDTLAADERERIREHLRAVPPPPDTEVWVSKLTFLQGELPPVAVDYVGLRLRDPTGTLLGTLMLYAPALPASILLLVSRGDPGMFGRMAQLIEPGRQRAAILFADLQSSTGLSRRLPTAAYFRLVRAATTAVDQVIIDHDGIVGKHTGDGVTAFFLAQDLGGISAAARSAIHAARALPEAAFQAAAALTDDVALIDDFNQYRINVGLHWGGTLYMGQVVTGGRLEVTALGDEVNACARIQESARDGQLLASKDLVERLDPEHATDLGIQPEALVYQELGELAGATGKAVRDAATVPVTSLLPADRSGR